MQYVLKLSLSGSTNWQDSNYYKIGEAVKRVAVSDGVRGLDC